MEQSTIYFIIIMVVIAGVSTGFGFYINDRAQTLQNDYVARMTQLSNELIEAQQAVENSLFVLDQKIELTAESLAEVDQQFHERLITATRDIQDVQKQSQAGLSQLEQQTKALETDILSINVQTQDFSIIIQRVIDGVVSIRTNKAVGSGAIVHRDGFIVTNAHVMEGATSAAVLTYDQKIHPVTLLAKSNEYDLALLKIEPGDYHVFDFDKTSRVGQKVAAMGSPGGLDFTVTEGIISSIDRQGAGGVTLIQTDVPINPGNSGGPLVSIEGRIVGINTLKKAGFEGVGFAINADTVDDFVDEAIDAYLASLEE